MINQKEKRKEQSNNKKERIIVLREEGYSMGEISKKENLPKSLVQKILENYSKYNSVQNPKRKGRKKCTTKAQDRIIVLESKKNPHFSLSDQQQNLNEYYGINLSTETIRLRLISNGIDPVSKKKNPKR